MSEIAKMGDNSSRGPAIHPTAIVAEGARIGSGTTIGPYSVIGPNVLLGENNSVASHVVIEGYTTIGDGNQIFQFASVGSIPQDLKYHGEKSTLTIGDGNKIREYVTIQPGTEGGGMKTVVGNNNLFMASSHIGHDTIMGSRNVVANSSAVAGHVIIESGVIIAGLCGVHQGVRLGELSMLGGGSMVNKDVPPFCRAQGDRAGLVGLNLVGMERANFSEETIRALKQAYRSIFLGSGLMKEKIAEIEASSTATEPKLTEFLQFLKSSTRGIAPARKKAPLE